MRSLIISAALVATLFSLWPSATTTQTTVNTEGAASIAARRGGRR